MSQIDAALGDPWETLGELITGAGVEDSSGQRRRLARCLASENYDGFNSLVPISRDRFDQVRQEFLGPEPRSVCSHHPEYDAKEMPTCYPSCLRCWAFYFVERRDQPITGEMMGQFALAVREVIEQSVLSPYGMT
jgi:hypothetical protein